MVKGQLSDCMRSMKVEFENLRKKGRRNDVLHKEPACDLTGMWNAQNRGLGSFLIWTSGNGTLFGFMLRENSCKLLGRISAHRVRFKQFWKNILITSLEGFVNETGSKMVLNYSFSKPDGTEESGVIVLRKERQWASVRQ